MIHLFIPDGNQDVLALFILQKEVKTVPIFDVTVNHIRTFNAFPPSSREATML